MIPSTCAAARVKLLRASGLAQSCRAHRHGLRTRTNTCTAPGGTQQSPGCRCQKSPVRASLQAPAHVLSAHRESEQNRSCLDCARSLERGSAAFHHHLQWPLGSCYESLSRLKTAASRCARLRKRQEVPESTQSTLTKPEGYRVLPSCRSHRYQTAAHGVRDLLFHTTASEAPASEARKLSDAAKAGCFAGSIAFPTTLPSDTADAAEFTAALAARLHCCLRSPLLLAAPAG